MSDAVKVGFVAFSAAPRGVLVVFCDDALKFGEVTRKALGKATDTVKRAAAANQFNAAINQIQALANSGRLDSATASSLMSELRAAIDLL